MFYGPPGSYAHTGKVTADLILKAGAGMTPRSWLDYGCGYGRVLRWITRSVSASSVGCYDVNHEGAAFCAREFGVTSLRSSAPMSDITLGRWDIVYAISVVTHLPGSDFFELLPRLLNPGGMVVFSTHGAWSVDHIGSYGPEYARQHAKVRAELSRDGISYIPYAYGDGSLGMTWHSHEHVLDKMRALSLQSYHESAIPGNHDVYVYRA